MKKLMTVLFILILLAGAVSAQGFLSNLFGKPSANSADNKLSNFGKSATNKWRMEAGAGLYDQPVAEPTGLQVANCIDSDNGLTFGVVGKVTGKVDPDEVEEGNFYDLCKDDKILIESFCSPWDGLVKFQEVYCKGGCESTADGALCSAPPYCLDTDPGQKSSAKGHVILFKSQGSMSQDRKLVAVMASNDLEIYIDTCLNSTTLVQYSCSASSTGVTESSERCDDRSVCCKGKCTKKSIADSTPECASKAEEEAKPKEESKGGFFNSAKNILSFGTNRKSAAADNSLAGAKGSSNQGSKELGAVDCAKGQQVEINGIPFLCTSLSKITYTLKLKAGYNEMLKMNIGSAANPASATDSSSANTPSSTPDRNTGSASGSSSTSGVGGILK